MVGTFLVIIIQVLALLLVAKILIEEHEHKD